MTMSLIFSEEVEAGKMGGFAKTRQGRQADRAEEQARQTGDRHLT